MENPYHELIEKLKSGEISEIIVEPAQFSTFREVWLTLEERSSIVGEAGLNGKIIYRFQK